MISSISGTKATGTLIPSTNAVPNHHRLGPGSLGPGAASHHRNGGGTSCLRLLPVIAVTAMSIAFPFLGRAAGVLYPNAVYQPTLDRIYVFVVGYEAHPHLYDKYWNGSSWVWEDQGIPPGATSVAGAASVAPSAPSAVYQPTLDRIAVFVTGDNGHLYDKYWNGSAWVWEDQGMPPGAASGAFAPSAVYQPTLDRISVFVVTPYGRLYDKYWNGSAWVWEDQGFHPNPTAGLNFLTAPSAVYQPTLDRISVFVTDEYQSLYDKYWNGNAWVWEDQGAADGAVYLNSASAIYQPTLDRISVFITDVNDHLMTSIGMGVHGCGRTRGLLPAHPGTVSPHRPVQSTSQHWTGSPSL